MDMPKVLATFATEEGWMDTPKVLATFATEEGWNERMDMPKVLATFATGGSRVLKPSRGTTARS
ncbi:hypothetical protein K227x_16620 [Rubripirellula lacrimiformis]|uniref:Uncharacterized protein n=1 Tax=Rubripirellula lacrimiformis TaxID=1930273 RepID=A0A517N834_9BACT|nr:hypothetical protein K227x_16620 [Rubripirellula lacrimiformis]